MKFIKSQFENSCQENQIIIHYILFPRVSPTGVLQSDVVAKLKIDEF